MPNATEGSPSIQVSSREEIVRHRLLEAELLGDPAVDECVVLSREGAAAPERVAYLVVGQHEDASSVVRRLTQRYAERWGAVVPVRALPMTRSGDVDLAAASRVPVRDVDVAAVLEARAVALPGVGRAVAVTGIFRRPAPRWHRDELSCSRSASVSGEPAWSAAVSAPAPSLVAPLAADGPPALRRGAPLPARDGEPTTLGEALCAAPPGSRIVFIGSDGAERRETYASQQAEAERLVGGLRALGLTPTHRVIFQLDRPDDIVPLFWGCMFGGFEVVIAPVPVSYDEPSRALTQLGELLELFEGATLVTSRQRRDEFRAGIGRTLGNVRTATIEELRGATPDARRHAASPDEVALYALSSGSTARSKAIALTHRNLLTRARGVNAECYGERDVVLNWLPFDHIGSISEGHVRPVLLGCELVYAPKEYVVGRPSRLLDLIGRHRVTHTWAPNFSYALVTAAVAREPSGAWDLSCVRMLLNAGELITTAAVEQFLSALTPFGLRRSAVQSAFGMAELCSGVTYHQPGEGESMRFHYVDRASLGGVVRATHPEDPAAIAFASLGSVIAGVSMRIVDAEGRVVRERECGRLQFQGQALSPGYYRNAEANRAFGADGWFDTGDNGFIVDGELVLTGRADAGIIINGANFSNGEIESLVEEVEGVVTSDVAACSVRARDGGAYKLAVFFHAEHFDEALLGRLCTAIQAHLARRLGVKADYLLPVAASLIPRTPIGKIQRKKLTEQFERGEHDALVRRIDLLLANCATFGAAYYRRFWQRKELVHAVRMRRGLTLFVVDREGLDDRLASELRRRDLPWVTLTSGQGFIDHDGQSLSASLDDAQDLRALTNWLSCSNVQVHTIVDLRGPSRPETASSTSTHGAVAPLGELVRAIHLRGQPREALRLMSVGNASLLAAAKRDVPGLRTVLLELTAAEWSLPERAADLVNEIVGGSADDAVAYRADGRWAAGLAPIERSSRPPGTLSFGRGQTYVVYGAGEGIGPRLVDALLDRFGLRLLLIDDARGASGPGRPEQLRSDRKAGGFRSIRLDAWDVERVEHALRDGSSGEGTQIHGFLHIMSDTSEPVGAEHHGRELAARLEQRALTLGCLAEIARRHEAASFIAISVLPNDAVGTLAIASQDEALLEPLRRAERGVHAVELAGNPADVDSIDGLLGAMRLGGHVVVEVGGAGALRSSGVLGEDLELSSTQLVVSLLETAAIERCAALVLRDRYHNPAPIELVPMREAGCGPSILRHLLELPLRSGGEVDRERLVQLAEAAATPAPHIPASAIESQIAQIWKEVLGIQSVSMHQSFFELGGHSLLLVQAHDRLSRAFGLGLTLVDLFKYPTVQALARFLGEGKPRETAASRGFARAGVRAERRASPQAEAVAVIGMACRFPGASDLDTFWQNLVDARESIATLTLDELLAAGIDPVLANHPQYVKASPRLDDVEGFDADFFGYSRRESALMDPQHRLLLECAWEAFEVAGHNPVVHRGPVGVYVGASLNTYLVNNLLPNRATLDSSDGLSVLTLDSMGGFQLMVAADKDYLPTRISYKLNLTGPSINVQTACSTGLVAVHLACQAILTGECDAALAGGASVKAPQAAGHLYREGMIVSPDGHCRAFDENARGTIFGSGVGAVLLKRLDLALRDRDPIIAVVKGSAVNNDGGLKVGYMAPSGDGQAAVVAEALAVAQVEPETVTFVEAHGTGTEMGDPIEIAGLSDAFRMGTQRRGYCAVGSVKTNVGHLQITSGTAGFIKTALALQRGMIPPTLHFQRPNPAIDFASSPFFVNTAVTAWPPGKRRAGVNSLGIGGTNAHAILEEAPPAPALDESAARSVHVLTVSAKRAEGLVALVARYRGWLGRAQPLELPDLCYTSNVGRAHFEHRLAICADSLPALQREIAVVGAASSSAATSRSARGRPKLLFLFTGQGSQSAGMARVLYETQPVFRATLERCAALLHGRVGLDLLAAIYPAPGGEGAIDHTELTQPALFALEYALYEMWGSFGVEPDMVSGHSVGEYVAACVAGVFSLEDGLALVAERGRLMARQPGSGSMAAVFASEHEVGPWLERHGDKLSIAALNGPAHTVISGDRVALETVLAGLSGVGVRHTVLRVSHAFHSPLMRAAVAPFERFVARFELSPPRVPMLSNVTGRAVEREVTEPVYWSRHLCAPVRFADGIAAARAAGCDHFLELGPRPSLLGLAASVVEGPTLGDGGVTMLASLRPGQDDWTTVTETMARLYAAGLALDWERFHDGADRRRIVLPTYPFQRERCWLDAPVASRSEHASRTTPGEGSLLANVPLSPLIPHRLWQGELSAQTAPFLSDHRVFDRIVVSGACYVALVIDVATRQLGALECEVCDVVFARALHVPEPEPVRVQLVLEPLPSDRAGVDRYQFRFISVQASADEATFSEHAEGVLVVRAEATAARRVDLTGLRARCTTPQSVAEFYGAQARRRIDLGHSYRWLESLRRGAGEAFAQLVAPAQVERGFTGPFHPGLIDACFGLLLSCEDLNVAATQVPFRIARIRVHARPEGGALMAHAVCQPGERRPPDGVSGSMWLLDAEGRELLAIERLEARHVLASAFVGLDASVRNDILYALEWQASPPERPREARLARGSVVVLGGDSATGGELARRIRAVGQRCYRVAMHGEGVGDDPWRLEPGDGDALRTLLERVEQPIAGVVHLEGCSGESLPEELDLGGLSAAHERRCGNLLVLVQALRRAGWQKLPPLWIVTRGGQAVLGGPVRLGQAPLWGLGRALSVEQPDLACMRIDLDPEGPVDQSGLLLEELARGPSSDEVAWRAGKRYVHRLVRSTTGGTRTATRATALDPGATYLITGGLGGLGRRVAVWLADKGARHLVLLGRHLPEALPSELRSLGDTGCAIEMACVDVAQPGAVADFIGQLQSRGRTLRGVLHLAGALDDGVLTQQNWGRFRRVMSSKVDGAINLHQATRALELDFFVCFSSIASVFGSPAQANYAAANAFLDALCQLRRREGRPALSVNWGPWGGSGMAASVRARDRERIADQGLLPLEPEEALRVLDALWGDTSPQRVVVRVDWPSLQRSYGGALPALFEAFASHQSPPVRRAFLRDEIESTPAPLRRRLLQKLVRTEVLSVLGSGVASHFDDRQGLAEMGLDSLQAIDVKSRLSVALGITLPSTLLFDEPSVQALADYLAVQMSDLFGAFVAEPPPPAAAAAGLEALSERELLDLLAEQLDAPQPARGGAHERG